jgi:GTP cyclohydrolase I
MENNRKKMNIIKTNLELKNKMDINYDYNFKPSQTYLDSMPDLAEGEIKGAHENIERVGISNFHLPLKIQTKDGGTQELEASIVGTVSLEGIKKGINMSRIIRTFYEYKSQTFNIDLLETILQDYRKTLGSFDADIMISFRYRIWQESLRSLDKNGNKNGGWQYYNITLEGNINKEGKFKKILHFDFVYSSTCPCSTDLSLHALETRNQYATPHSQRSVMRASIEFGEFLWIEDIHELMLSALKTETQVFVKREDEQAFAELNAANTKFVEDAVRLVYERFISNDNKILDFKLIASHNESLHSHDAIAVMIKGVNGGFNDRISPNELKSLLY